MSGIQFVSRVINAALTQIIMMTLRMNEKAFTRLHNLHVAYLTLAWVRPLALR